MAKQKESELSFDGDSKESFKMRLKQVIGQRSVRSAAISWGLSYSTLNNYLTRGTEPSFFVMSLVALKENLSLDWLAYGVGSPYKDNKTPINESMNPSKDPLAVAWDMAFDSLGPEDVKALIALLMREGAKGLLAISNKYGELENQFAELPTEDKERLLSLQEAYEEAKKGASQGGGVNESDHLQADERQAG